MALPASSWMAGEPLPRLSQSTKWQALAVNWPSGLRIQTQRSIGPQNEQLTRLTLPSAFGPISRQTESVLPQRPTNSPLVISSPGGCACSTSTARRQRIGAEAEEVAVGAARLRLGELVAHAVAEAERVEDVVPVGAGQLEGDALRVDPFAVRIVGLVGHAERPEVDVLDVADVVALIHEDAALARIAGDVADQVPGGADQLDGLVGIEEAAVA